ncbi:MAG TPA: hypothetical protein VGG79_07020 [Roseiarcus sp.]|jgi:hypothetical protein
MNLDSAGQALNSGAGAITSGPGLDLGGKRTEERSGDTAILVLGMHRSGTSSLAGALVRLGVTPPLNLIPPNDDNPKGFWESTVIVALNDEILAAGGSHWEDWRPFDPTRIDPAVGYTLKTRARSALIREFGEASLAVIKDPRICRLIPFWSSALQDSGWSPRAILPLRSPLEVASSLERRNGIPLGVGCLIWLRHVLDAEAGTRSMRRAVVDWSGFLRDPPGALERVGEQLKVEWPRWTEHALTEIHDFVSGDLRRQRASDSDLLAHPAVNDLVRETYAVVPDLVENPRSGKVERTLDDIAERLRNATGMLGYAMFELEDGRRRRRSAGAPLGDEYGRQLTAAREEFAARLAEARSESRRLVEVTDRDPPRASSRPRQYRRDGRGAAVARFRDYLRGRTNESEELAAIRNSVFFNAEFYLNSNPDVGASGMDAALHYLAHGAREGRDPGPRFSTHEYLVQFPDVAASGLNPLAHYEIFGRREMRRIPFSRP